MSPTSTSVPQDPRLQVYKHVWLINKADTDYEEKVNGQVYKIKAKGKIKLPRHEAAQVRGQWPGNKVIKMLAIEPIFPTEAELGIEKKSYVSQIDGKEFDTQEALNKHLEDLRKKMKG